VREPAMARIEAFLGEHVPPALTPDLTGAA